jgi:tetratricopeptide (TPR) repeat protein
MGDLGSDRAKRIGGFRLGAKIRSGPVIAVFESEDEQGRRVEISLYRGSALRDRITVDTFLDEVERTRKIEHENLCPILTAGAEGDIWHASAAVPDAPTLRELLDRGGALAAERVRVIAEGVISALGSLSEAGLRHGDVRPETIFLSGGKALLATRRLIPLATKERDTRYVSPEEMAGGGGDVRADLFSVGAVLIEALTGSPPAPAGSPERALEAIRAGPPAALAEISPVLAALVASLYAEKVEHRPSDPTTVARALSGEISLAAAEPQAPAPAPPAGGPPVGLRAPALAALPARRGTGRLRFSVESGTAMWDLLDDETFLTLGKRARISVSTEASEADLVRIERGAAADVLTAIPDREPRVRVNGSLVDRHELSDLDLIRLGDEELTYETVRLDTPRNGGPPRARREKRRAGLLALGTTCLCLIVVAWAAWRVYRAFGEGEEVLRAAAEAEARLSGEEDRVPEVELIDPAFREAAEAAYREASEFAKEHPDAFDAIRKRFYEVQRLYGQTEYGYLAYKQLDRLSERRSEAVAKAYEEVVSGAAQRIEEDRLYKAYLLYFNFAEDHPDSVYADRATREAESLEEALEVRFDEDMRRAQSAIEAGEYGRAIDILNAVKAYASPDLRNRAREKMEQVRKHLQETQVPGAEPVNPEAPPPDPPEPEGPGPEEPAPTEPPPPDPAAEKEERRAAAIFEDAAKAMDRARWPDAVKHLEKLLGDRYRGTRFVTKNLAEIERMHGLARLERDGVASLFKGQVKRLRGREVILTYGFDTAEEEEDWRFINPFADPGSALFERRTGGYYARGVGALAHDAVFEPESLRMRAVLQAIKPTDLGLQMFEPEEMLRYYMFTIQNRYFTIGAERTPLHENVIWIFGGGAWADNPDGEIGFIRVAKSPNPAVSSGEKLTLDVAKVGNNVTMSIKNTPPLRGSAMGDDRYVYPALRPALCVLQGEALFESVEIQGVIQKKWAEAAMARARKKLTR